MLLHLLALLAASSHVWPLVEGHGRLVDPPSRASAWRYGFNTPANYDDNQLFCGGKSYQWDQQGGRCGVCGDPYSGPREHEAGGRYATGTIVRSYTTGQIVNVKVQLTANHKGWFEFRLCPVNNPTRKATQACLDRHLLPLADGSGTRVPISSDMMMVDVALRLPAGLSCRQCMLQWKYNTGNSWGVDRRTDQGCVGCGPQEQFYGCSDISIHQSSSSGSHPNSNPGPNPDSYPGNRPVARPTRRPNIQYPRPGYRPRPPTEDNRKCRAIGAWRGQATMDRWCVANCNIGNCPRSHCICPR